MFFKKMCLKPKTNSMKQCLSLACVALMYTVGIGAAEAENELLLKPERTLSFKTSEGTWISLDVSRRSGEIVFELLGDLYTLPSKGGNAKPITTGMAYDSQPVFSPDSSKIAFISDRSGNENVWIANADGSDSKQITHLTAGNLISPAWSADGYYIYVSKADLPMSTPRLWVYHIAGGSGMPLNGNGPDTAQANELGAYATADGKYVYYANRQGPLFSDALSNWNIARRNLDTGRQEKVLSVHGSSLRPVVSPDGRYLAYTSRLQNNTELRLRDLHTLEDRRLAYPITRDMQETVASRDMSPGYDFTADSNAVVISYNGKIKRIDINTAAVTDIPFLAEVNLDVAPSLKLAQTNPTGPIQARVVQAPRLSPNGKKLTFSAFGKIYVMPVSGGTPKRLTQTPLSRNSVTEHYPAWSPDGNWITYVTWTSKDGDERGHIWKVKAAGGQPKRLTSTPAFYRKPAFTPDGKSIIALRGSAYDRAHTHIENRNRPNIQDIVRVASSGGPLQRVTNLSNSTTFVNLLISDLGRPHFDAAGKYVFAYTSEGLMKTPITGGEPEKVIQVSIPDFYFENQQSPVEDVVRSPDGNWLLALVDSQLYLVAMPHTGDKNTEVDVLSPTVPVKRLTDIGANYFAWADNGQTITWAIGSTFYQLPLNSVNFETKTSDNSERNQTDSTAFSETSAQRLDIAVEIPRDMPRGIVVLRGATAITMKGNDIIENADIVVTDNRITAIGARGQVTIPNGAEIHDLTGKVVTPGFIDTHAHWKGIHREVVDYNSWPYAVNLAYGVTAGLDVQGMTHDEFFYQDLLDAGVMVGPRAYTVGRGVFSSNRFSSRQHALGVLKRYKEHYRTNNLKAYMSGNRMQRQYVADAARELGIMPTTEGGADTKLDLTHAIDGFAGNEHSLPVTPLYEDIVQLYAQTQIGYTPTLLVSYGGPAGIEHFYAHQNPLDDPKLNRFTPRRFIADQASRRAVGVHTSEHIYPSIAESAVRVFRAGGNIGIGGHGELQGLGYHWELQAMAEGGATPHEILQMATISSAQVIGQHKELGSLEPGKFADLIVFNQSPLEDIRHTVDIAYVMKNGRFYNGDDLNEVWPGK